MREAEAKLLKLLITHPRIKDSIAGVSGQPLGQWQPSALTQPICELLAVALGVIDQVVRVIQALVKGEVDTANDVVAVNPARHIQAITLH